MSFSLMISLVVCIIASPFAVYTRAFPHTIVSPRVPTATTERNRDTLSNALRKGFFTVVSATAAMPHITSGKIDACPPQSAVDNNQTIKVLQ